MARRPHTTRNPSVHRLSLFLRALVHSAAFVSTAAASVAVSTLLLADVPFTAGPPCIAFAATMFVYSLDRVADADDDEHNSPGRVAFLRRHGRSCLAVGGSLYAVAVAGAVLRGVPGVEFLSLPVVAVVLYSFVGLKRLLFVKNALVGLAWGVIPLGVGAYVGALGHPVVMFLCGYVSVMVTVAAAVFDVKDVEGDRLAGIRTLPVVYGAGTTRRLALVGNAVVATVVVALVAGGVIAPRVLAVLAVNLYVGGYTIAATKDRGALFYGFVIDGEHVFLAVVLTVVRTLGMGG